LTATSSACARQISRNIRRSAFCLFRHFNTRRQRKQWTWIGFFY
jgi:hypothetical protein